LFASNIAYLGADSTIISGGSHWWDFTKTGTTTTIGLPVGTATFLPQVSYDAFVSDSGGVELTQTLPNILPDTVSTDTKVRIVNVLPTPNFPFSGSTGYDVYLTAPGADLTLSSPATTALTFGLNSQANFGPTYLSETPGPTEVRVEPAGDTVAADVIIDATTTLTASQPLSLFLVEDAVTPTAGNLVVVRDK
jgi:hypothetical protein